MTNIVTRLTVLFTGRRIEQAPQSARTQDLHVVVPESVELPLPRVPQQEMSVPASINGRDLSTGRL